MGLCNSCGRRSEVPGGSANPANATALTEANLCNSQLRKRHVLFAARSWSIALAAVYCRRKRSQPGASSKNPTDPTENVLTVSMSHNGRYSLAIAESLSRAASDEGTPPWTLFHHINKLVCPLREPELTMVP
jgi:hypothetical protein